jgi:antitoxin StbD
MADSYLTVRPVSEAREELSRALARFRREGASAAPIIFGSHRKPEAVVIPFEAYAGIVEELDRRRAAAEATGSVVVELPGQFSDEFKADMQEAVDGRLTPDELYERTVARYRDSRKA